MIYVCNTCGHLVEEENLKYVVEPHGERHIDYNCNCCHKGELIEASICKVCGKPFDNTELHGVCEGCLEEYETVGEAIKYGSESKVNVSINECLAYLLTENEIERILTKWVEENFTDRSKPIVEYCESDKSAFSEYLEEKYG